MLMAMLLCACDGTHSAAPQADNSEQADHPIPDLLGSRTIADHSTDTDTASISGLWDASDADDTLLIYIDRSGHWYGYDYAADAHGDGQNCHYIFGPYRVVPLDDHRYQWHDSLGSREIRLVREGEALRYSDTEGDWQLPAVAGVDKNDLAVCGKIM